MEHLPKPWSDDWVFQQTYFCNVRREDDKVTKWIRQFYSSHVLEHMFEYNIILSRFINLPKSLDKIGWISQHNPADLRLRLDSIADSGKLWGSAYIITTHGMKMGKTEYLTEHVLQQAFELLEALRRPTTCQGAWQQLQAIEGIGSFLAAQIVADLKNTPGHTLCFSPDWLTFVAPGPGSIKGASWFHFNEPGKVTVPYFLDHFKEIRRYVDNKWDEQTMGMRICNQDLQNCLCEFDKYMRVRTGTGRSKRAYDGE